MMITCIQKLAGSEVLPPCGALWQPAATCGCCESMHCSTASSRRLLWSHLHTFTTKYWWFWKLQEAAANPLLKVWNLEEFAVKPFGDFYNEILMVLNFQEAAVKPFAQISNEILIFQWKHISSVTLTKHCDQLKESWWKAKGKMNS